MSGSVQSCGQIIDEYNNNDFSKCVLGVFIPLAKPPKEFQMTTLAPSWSFLRANRIAAIAMSEIVQTSEAAATMRAAGKGILSVATGEPYFPTSAHVCDAAAAAVPRSTP